MRILGGKISIFAAKISDDLCFLVIDQIFRFSLSFPRFSLSLLCQMSYLTLSSQEKHLFFTLFILSRASNNTTSLNIGGNQCMGRPPTSNFGGTVPPSPPRSPPLHAS